MKNAITTLLLLFSTACYKGIDGPDENLPESGFSPAEMQAEIPDLGFKAPEPLKLCETDGQTCDDDLACFLHRASQNEWPVISECWQNCYALQLQCMLDTAQSCEYQVVLMCELDASDCIQEECEM